MIIGVPSETKVREYRVGLIPAGVAQLVQRGHKVLVQQGAGEGSGIPDAAYTAVGAEMVSQAHEVWERADMIVKVKEPIQPEYELIQPNQILFTYFHLAAVPALADVLIQKKVAAVAYETIELADRSLPLLKPMSEVAGKMSVQVGAQALEKAHGGKGVLLGGVPGVRRGKITILGGGVVGMNAAKIAVGMGADVTLLDLNLNRLEYLDNVFGGRVTTLYSDPVNIERTVSEADLVVGAVLITGAKAPQLVTHSLIKKMEPGSVVVDVAVDQGGCIETCRPTTHDDPTYVVDGVVHYCVANMPGAVAHTSTFALNNATIPYARALADQGLVESMGRDPALAKGLNAYNGVITHRAVADSLGLPFKSVQESLGLV